MMGRQLDPQKKAVSLLACLVAKNGFSLVELMVGMAVTGIVATTILGSYITISKHVKAERDTAVMQMSMSNAVENIEQAFRMAGYDPQHTGSFGVTDVRRYSLTDTAEPAVSSSGNPAITLIYDDYSSGAGDGVLDANDTYISYRLYDEGGDGIFELARDTKDGTGANFTRQILAENIQAIGFAYAIDEDGDGQLDRSGGGNIIWAVDSDNGGDLDLNIDANGDGLLDENDANGDNVVNSSDVSAQGNWPNSPAPLTSIRAVKIWILARADRPTKGYLNQNTYRVGDRVFSASNGDFDNNLKTQLIVRDIECRNMQ